MPHVVQCRAPLKLLIQGEHVPERLLLEAHGEVPFAWTLPLSLDSPTSAPEIAPLPTDAGSPVAADCAHEGPGRTQAGDARFAGLRSVAASMEVEGSGLTRGMQEKCASYPPDCTLRVAFDALETLGKLCRKEDVGDAGSAGGVMGLIQQFSRSAAGAKVPAALGLLQRGPGPWPRSREAGSREEAAAGLVASQQAVRPETRTRRPGSRKRTQAASTAAAGGAERPLAAPHGRSAEEAFRRGCIAHDADSRDTENLAHEPLFDSASQEAYHWVAHLRRGLAAKHIMEIVATAEAVHEGNVEVLLKVYDAALDAYGLEDQATASPAAELRDLCVKRMRALCRTDPAAARQFHRELRKSSVGNADARLFEARAALEVRLGDHQAAARVLEDGLRSGAEPMRFLQRALARIQQQATMAEGSMRGVGVGAGEEGACRPTGPPSSSSLERAGAAAAEPEPPAPPTRGRSRTRLSELPFEEAFLRELESSQCRCRSQREAPDVGAPAPADSGVGPLPVPVACPGRAAALVPASSMRATRCATATTAAWMTAGRRVPVAIVLLPVLALLACQHLRLFGRPTLGA